jgi:hypothetical protein
MGEMVERKSERERGREEEMENDESKRERNSRRMRGGVKSGVVDAYVRELGYKERRRGQTKQAQPFKLLKTNIRSHTVSPGNIFDRISQLWQGNPEVTIPSPRLPHL